MLISPDIFCQGTVSRHLYTLDGWSVPLKSSGLPDIDLMYMFNFTFTTLFSVIVL